MKDDSYTIMQAIIGAILALALGGIVVAYLAVLFRLFKLVAGV